MKVTKFQLSAVEIAERHLSSDNELHPEHYQVEFNTGAKYLVTEVRTDNADVAFGVEQLIVCDNGRMPIAVMGLVDIAAHFWGIGAMFTVIPDINKHNHTLLRYKVLNTEEVNL